MNLTVVTMLVILNGVTSNLYSGVYNFLNELLYKTVQPRERLMASVMRVHIPQNNSSHIHFAFVAMEVDLTKVGKLPYDDRVIGCEFTKTVLAGLYGFPNKELRNRFVSSLNGAADIELAFIASLNPATGPVVKAADAAT